MSFQQKEQALLRAMAKATTLGEQAALAEELEALRAGRTASVRQERDLSWADTVVDRTLGRATAHVYHTAATDWMEDIAPAPAENAHTAMMAEASVWFSRTSPEVRADREEFGIQASGMARKVAGKYGEQAPAAARAFLDYVAFLHQREAASGLDQVQQTTAPDGVTQKSTPLPEETFDTFMPEAPWQDWPSTNNELLERIVNGQDGPTGGAQAGGGRPSEHDTGDSLEGHYGPGPQHAVGSLHSEDDGDPFAGLFSRSLALNYTGSLADWTERLAKESKEAFPGAAKPFGSKDDEDEEAEDSKKEAGIFNKKPKTPDCTWSPGSGDRDVFGDMASDHRPTCPAGSNCKAPVAGRTATVEHIASYDVIAASGLPQVQQVVDSFENPAPKPLPPDVAFPLVEGFTEEMGESGNGPAIHSTSAREDDDEGFDKRKRTKKEKEDARGAYNPSEKGDEDDDDRKEASLKTADMFGASDRPHEVPGHEREGYNTEHNNTPKKAEHASGEKDSPWEGKVAPKSDANGHPGRGSEHTTTNTGEQKAWYRKGYKFAAKWTPGMPLVATGSADFEVGLYDGMKANSRDNRMAWVQAHKAQSVKHAYLADRLVAHARRTAALKTAGTDTDLDTVAPSTRPDEGGNTPFSGEGKPGPLDGQKEVNAPAGAAPYNAAEPRGHAVVPGHNATPPAKGPSDPRDPAKSMYDGPMNKGQRDQPMTTSISGQTLAFRQRVQAKLLAETEWDND